MNAAPVIQSLAASVPLVSGVLQVDVSGDQTVQLTATVTDAETSPATLAYTWSSSAGGTFIGNGPQVGWRAPAGSADPATVTLTVVESYTQASTAKENRVSSTVQVRYNESMIGGLVTQFLKDFGNFSVSPQVCVRNFSATMCSSGRAEELGDVTGQRNQSGVQVESATVGTPAVTVSSAATSASIAVPCSFRDRFSNGTHQTVTGTCNLTAVYDTSRWYLCTSRFNDGVVTTDRLGSSVVTTSRTLPPFSHP